MTERTLTRPPRPMAPRAATTGGEVKPAGTVRFGAVSKPQGRRIMVYGPGGIGKTSLALLAPGPVAVFDLDESLPDLSVGGQLEGLDVRAVEGIGTWAELRSALQGGGWDDIQTVVIDSVTRAEELATAHTLETVPHEKGQKVNRIEDYGFGKGYTHVYETFLTLLGDLDRHVRAGRHVILIAHDCTANVPNPQGDDYIRFEPRLQAPTSGKASIRLRLREWLAFLFFVGYDLDVKNGVARGENTRSIYTCEMPHCMAKRRPLLDVEGVATQDVVPYEDERDGTIWRMIFGE